MAKADVVVIGSGIVGLATTHALLRARPELRVIVVEKEDRVGAHQSSHNSGVIHSGIYYRQNSLKARLVRSGRRALLDLCRSHGVAHRTCGKVIVAVEEREVPLLSVLLDRAATNGVRAELIGPARLTELEPHARGIAAIHVPEAGIVDFEHVCRTLAQLCVAAGVELRFGREVVAINRRNQSVVVSTHGHEDMEAAVVVNCAGLQADQVAAAGGTREEPRLRIVPFRGSYHDLRPERTQLVTNLIYPVPDPRYPFLGVHFTKTTSGTVHAGPNAVLALAREGYSWRVIDVAELIDLLRFPGFRRMVASHWRTGARELHRSLSRRAFLQDLQRLVPDIRSGDLVPAPAGVRAQAVDLGGELVDDFVIEESSSVINVLNAPSPAATAALEIGRMIAERVLPRLTHR